MRLVKTIIALSIFASSSAFAGINQSVDADGLRCSVNVDEPFELYVEGAQNDYDNIYNQHDNSYYRDDKQIRVGVKYKFGSGIKPIDCDSLFQVELQKKNIELERLKAELENMKALDSLNAISGQLPQL